MVACTVSLLINQYFGRSREPFRQQADVNLMRSIIELHRLVPGGWVTLRDVYLCTIAAELFAREIGKAGRVRPVSWSVCLALQPPRREVATM